MALKSPLGFGLMRLPTKSSDPTDFDYEQINEMVDTFLDAGYTYFDTSYVYHDGKSEEAARKAIVERHPRDSFTIATKFPTFNIQSEEEIEPIFAEQLENLGVDFIDYYLLHNIQTILYDGVDGEGGVIKDTHLFDHAKKWKEEGKIKHLGISFHSSADTLDRVLSEHPEIEFVQIALNYIDWESELVQAKEVYDVIRKHGKKVIIMEPVKGGGLALVPEEVEKFLKEMDDEASIASWALRFAGGMDDVICILSGMSSTEQVLDNIHSVKELQPLSGEEKDKLSEVVRIYRDAGPYGADLSKYEGKEVYGVPLTAILEAYNICQLQPDPGFSDDNNYLKNAIAENSHLDFSTDLPREEVILDDGTDVTEDVAQVLSWLKENSF